MNIQATIGNCNFLVYFLFFSILYRFHGINEYELKLYEKIGIALIFILSIIIMTRGAFISIFLSFLYIFSDFLRKNNRKKLIFAIFIVFLLFFIVNYKDFTKIKGDIRYLTNRVGIEMVKKHPFIGIGAGNTRVKYLNYQANFLKDHYKDREYIILANNAKHLHNEYLQMLAESGPISLIIYILFLLYSYKVLKKNIFLLSSFIFIHIAFLFSFLLYSPVTAMLILLPLLGMDDRKYSIDTKIVVIPFFILFSWCFYSFLSEMRADYYLKLSKKNPDNKISILEKAKEYRMLFPGKEDFLIGIKYFNEKKYEKAALYFLNSSEKISDYALYYDIGICFEKSRDKKGAGEFLERAFWMDPKRKEAYSAIEKINKNNNINGFYRIKNAYDSIWLKK